MKGCFMGDSVNGVKVGDVVRIRQHYPFVAGRVGTVNAVHGPMTRDEISHVLTQTPAPHAEFFDGMVELELDGGQDAFIGVHWVEPVESGK
jgi:hypothetical protein